MGVNNSELWNNLGLCCFYSSQYDMALNCMDRALHLASDEDMSDVWYNIGHVGVALGDLGLAYQGFKVAVSIDPSHGEALNNLAVLESRRLKPDLANSYYCSSIEVAPQLFEPLYNSGVCPSHMCAVDERCLTVDASALSLQGRGVPGGLSAGESRAQDLSGSRRIA